MTFDCDPSVDYFGVADERVERGSRFRNRDRVSGTEILEVQPNTGVNHETDSERSVLSRRMSRWRKRMCKSNETSSKIHRKS